MGVTTNAIPTHTTEELNAVAVSAQNGDESAKAQLVTMMRPYVVAYLHNPQTGYRFKNYDRAQRDEMTQHAWVGVWTALERFDPTRGVKFSTYARDWMRHEVMEYIARNSGVLGMPRKSWHYARLLDQAWAAEHGLTADINDGSDEEIEALLVEVVRRGERHLISVPGAAEIIRARKSGFALDTELGRETERHAESAEDAYFARATQSAEEEAIERAYMIAGALAKLPAGERTAAAEAACVELGWPPEAAETLLTLEVRK